jgi:hypothetical protein
MKIPACVWLLSFIRVGLIAVQAVLKWYRADEEQTRREEEEGGCQFFRTYDSLLTVSAFDSLGGVLT